MKEERITICIDQQEHSLLSSLSLRENKTESEIVREALRMYFQSVGSQISCYDLAKDLGIIGIAGDMPSDLSTNTDYLEEFGK
ncbi:CopG family transcriptional regulator [Anabaena cylindrica UHCC 0172]|uniref:CopG family transcriptional regulator n=1 Tax=Anabaena cylindrica TaxID=1165 RepID=UPI002B215CE1|nr:CopG family transcriptional regulator [Anabaena cylindrica]MEA5551435.1 CopG family transcriptional regulator [Anabaena cylindrica UHCC 0172]